MELDIIQVTHIKSQCKILLTFALYFIVLVAHNGFPFDFLFLVAEVKRHPSLTFFRNLNVYFR